MAIIPDKLVLTNSSVDVINAIRNTATQYYKDKVPVATPDAESIKSIGVVIMDSPQLQNEFLSALVNRIARVMVTSKTYENPWSMFKKGVMEMGETIEEIFVNLAKPYQFDVDASETELFKRVKPDVRSAFHVMNYQKFYKQTIQDDQLRTAFLSWNGVTDLIARIVDGMYTGANYDEFQTMKYLLAKHIVDGLMNPVEVDPVTSANMKSIVATIKGVSNAMEFMSADYNLAGVMNYTKKDDQFIIVNAKFDATMDVEVLASAFNMDKAEFMGHRVLIDGFGKLDLARLNELFKDDPTYSAFDTATLQALDSIPAVIVDREWFMIFDNIQKFTETYNSQGLYWNYFYHVWKTFSVSPFANNSVFIAGTPAVTSISVSVLSEVNLPKSQVRGVYPTGTVIAYAIPTVVTSNFAPKSVVFEQVTDENTTGVRVELDGKVWVVDGEKFYNWYPDESETDGIEIKATSTFDETKSESVSIDFTNQAV